MQSIKMSSSQQVLVVKEYNLQHHYETLHVKKYKNLQRQQRNREERRWMIFGWSEETAVCDYL